jgi:hypothetical protein
VAWKNGQDDCELAIILGQQRTLLASLVSPQRKTGSLARNVWSRFPHNLAQEIPEQRLEAMKDLTLKERLAGLSAELIEQFLETLQAESKHGQPKKRKRK